MALVGTGDEDGVNLGIIDQFMNFTPCQSADLVGHRRGPFGVYVEYGMDSSTGDLPGKPMHMVGADATGADDADRRRFSVCVIATSLA